MQFFRLVAVWSLASACAVAERGAPPALPDAGRSNGSGADGGEPSANGPCVPGGGGEAVPERPSDEFAQLCASCHGADGRNPTLEPLPVRDDRASFVAAVRRGGRTMRGYTANEIDDDTLARDYAFLAKIPVHVELSACPPPPPEEPVLPPVPPLEPCTPAVVDGPPSGRLSEPFQRLCVECHADDGAGKQGMPPIRGLAFARYRSVVRQGSPGHMPAFDGSWITDSQLANDLALLSGRALAPSGEPGCEQVAIHEPAPRPLEAAVLARGLEAWRRADEKGAACESCHGPYPNDLVRIGFSDGDILRRALKHVPGDDALAVLDFVHALRGRTFLPPADPDAYRPLQPGGAPIEGPVLGRDLAFGRLLEERGLTLASGRIRSLDDARQALAALVDLDLTTLPVGIEMNRWAEDEFHGPGHATLADWLPDLPLEPRPGHLAAWRALEDAWIASPTRDNLDRLLDGIDAHLVLVGMAPAPPGEHRGARLFVDKFRAVLVAQHLFGREIRGEEGLSAMGRFPFANRNAPWAVGDDARAWLTEGLCGEPGGCLGIPDSVVAPLSSNGAMQLETYRIEPSWFWAGFQLDSSLEFSGTGRATADLQYFPEAAGNMAGPMPLHEAFVVVRKIATVATVPGAWPAWTGVPARWGHARVLQLTRFSPLDAEKRATSDEHRAEYQRFMANGARAMLYLLADELRRTHAVYGRDQLSASVEPLAAYLAHAAPDDPEDARLVAEVRTLVGEAQDDGL